MKFFYLFLFIFLFSQKNESDKNFKNQIIVKVQNTKESYFFNEDILLKIKIINDTKNNIRFYLYDNSYKNFIFNLLNEKNLLEKNFNYLAWMDNKNSLSQKKRLVELKNNESFTIEINLSDFFLFKNFNKDYFFEGKFFLNSDIYFSVNIIPFKIKINKIALKDKNTNIQTNNKLIEKWAPHKVIENMLIYQKKNSWNLYFDFIHLPDYLINDYKNSDFYKRYFSSYENEKNSIFEQFKSFLTKKIDYKIDRAEIKKTIIEKEQANVIVWLNTTQYQYVEKINDNFTLKNTWKLSQQNKINVKKTFNFELKKIFGLWKIVSKKVTIGHVFPNEQIKKISLLNIDNTAKISNNTINIDNSKNNLINSIYYNMDDFTVQEKYYSILNNILDILNENKSFILKIIGYSSLEGTKEYNYQLALKRANMIKNFLVKGGISKNQLLVTSKGSLESKNNNEPLDRRVELYLKIN